MQDDKLKRILRKIGANLDDGALKITSKLLKEAQEIFAKELEQ